MPNRPHRRFRTLRGLALIALAFAVVPLASTTASAQIGQKLADRARRFYGPDYSGRGYADSLGLRGHKRCENGGYYGPPQIYSRQYGTMYGYRRDEPFAPLRNSDVASYPGAGN